jgi:hypothetical protein
MARRVANRISFGFDDATYEANAGKFADENFANEKPSQLDRVDRQTLSCQGARKLHGRLVSGFRAAIDNSSRLRHAGAVLP